MYSRTEHGPLLDSCYQAESFSVITFPKPVVLHLQLLSNHRENDMLPFCIQCPSLPLLHHCFSHSPEQARFAASEALKGIDELPTQLLGT